MKGERLRTHLRRFGAVFGLVLLGAMAARLATQLDALRLPGHGLDWQAFALALALFFVAQWAFARSWHRLVHAEGEQGEFAGDAARWAVSLAGKYFPGKVWQAVARYGLYHGAERGARVAPAFLREMLLGTSAAMACVAFGARHAGPRGEALAPLFAFGALVLALLAAPGIGSRLSALAERWMPGRAQLADTRWRVVLAAWAWQLCGYVLLGLGFFALAGGAGWPDPAWVSLCIAALCFGGLAGIAAFFVPAGIGVREAAIAWFLAPAIGEDHALVLALLARAWITAGELILVLGGLAWLRRHPRGAEPVA